MLSKTQTNKEPLTSGVESSNKLKLDEHELRTEMEFFLYKEIKRQQRKNDNMQDIIMRLEKELSEVKKELLALKEEKCNRAPNSTVTKNSEQEYETDEEQLEWDVGWAEVEGKKNKKRKMRTSPVKPTSQAKQQETQIRTQQEKKGKPPPIIINNVNKYEDLYAFIEENRIKAKITVIGKEDIKVNVENEEQYRTLTKALNKGDSTWYTYKNKATRPIKVMAKGIHPSCDPQKIVVDIQKNGLKIMEATNILSRKDRLPLSMFMLTFKNEEEIKKIYEVDNIRGMKVKIEAIHKPKLIPQCKRCQDYGYTQAYCSREPRCVKCAGKHLTKDCRKNAQVAPKCANCNQNHPANYRGCEIAKQKQRERNVINKGRDIDRQKQRQIIQQHRENNAK